MKQKNQSGAVDELPDNIDDLKRELLAARHELKGLRALNVDGQSSAPIQKHELLSALVDNSPVIMWLKDDRGRYIYLNRSYEKRFSIKLEDYLGHTDFDFSPRDAASRYQHTDLKVLNDGQPVEEVEIAPAPTGNEHFWWVMKFPVMNAAGERFIGGVAVDITERKRVEEEVRLQSLTDEMTGLYNRRGLLLLAEQEYPLMRRHKAQCALFFADLDRLKLINDQYGHDQGDEAIIAVGELLRVSFRRADLISRVGGDEFAVLAPDCSDPESLLQRLRANIDDFNQRQTLPFTLALSIGWVPFTPKEGELLTHFISQADARMYESKRGKPLTIDPEKS